MTQPNNHMTTKLVTHCTRVLIVTFGTQIIYYTFHMFANYDITLFMLLEELGISTYSMKKLLNGRGYL